MLWFRWRGVNGDVFSKAGPGGVVGGVSLAGEVVSMGGVAIGTAKDAGVVYANIGALMTKATGALFVGAGGLGLATGELVEEFAVNAPSGNHAGAVEGGLGA